MTLMDTNPITIEDLQVERKRLLARVEHIDKLLAAAQLLKTENVSLSGSVEIKIATSGNRTSANSESRKRTDKSGQVAKRNSAVQDAIERFGKKRFSGPDIARATGLDKRRVKRALDMMIEKGAIQIAEKGFKRRPTLYKAVSPE